jgi:hypothetical protein
MLILRPNKMYSQGSNKRLAPLMVRVCMCLLLGFGVTGANANTQIFSNWFADKEPQSEEPQQTGPVKTDKQKHQAAFGEIVYLYFQEDYQNVLVLIEVGQKNHQFSLLEQDNTDRLNLMQGAAQLQLGLYKKSQEMFARLLSQTTSDYVQANTWFFMAKAGFENKQAYLTERAYSAIQQGELREHLSEEQWYELIYLTAYTRMQIAANSTQTYILSLDSVSGNSSALDENVSVTDGDWQSLYKQIPQQSIYNAYLLANHATNLFNLGNYEQATNTFASAKKALLAYQNRKGFIREVATNIFDSVSFLITPWTWFDGNSTAEQVAQEREQAQEEAEQDALFDRINIGLGQSLLQQGDLDNAIAVIQNIAEGGGESEQALLTYGWANARENRWQAAMSAWQYLQQNSVGLFALQANYGLAYAFGQQDNLGQAFFALRSTAQQIDTSLNALDEFSATAQGQDFFNQYNEQWPQSLRDLKLGFFAPTQNFDAQYLLSMREQSTSILKDINKKSERLNQLTQMLYEREATYADRSNSLSIAQAEQQITQTQSMINALEQMLTVSDSFEAQLALSKRMADDDMNSHIVRLDRASARLIRLQNDTTRKRPIRASYEERVNRLQGIVTWQLMDTFIANRWQHQGLLKQAQAAAAKARLQYQRLRQIQQDKDAFKEQRAQLATMMTVLGSQSNAAETVYNEANQALVAHLLYLIDSRKQQLQQQSVNTRLAMLRIQDLRQQGGQ